MKSETANPNWLGKRCHAGNSENIKMRIMSHAPSCSPQYRNKAIAFFIVILSGLLLRPVSAQPSQDSGEFPSIFQLVTNCPPIADLVFKYHFGVEPAELYEFRCQSNAFFVRITKNASFDKDFSLQDTECGRWDGDYWYYTYAPPPRVDLQPPPPVLNKYSL